VNTRSPVAPENTFVYHIAKLILPAVSLSAAIFLVLNVVYPLHDHIFAPMYAKSPASVRFILDIGEAFDYKSEQHDHMLTKMLLSGFVGYWAIGIPTTIMDCFPGVFLHMKTQGSRSIFTVREWVEAVCVSMGNLFFSAMIISFLLWKLWSKLHNGQFMSENDPWVLTSELPKMAINFVVVDLWFYWTHRLIHYGPLYRMIHKFHHRFTAPTSVASMYANPLEFMIGNLGGVVLGPVFTNCHPLTTLVWICASLISTGMHHSGYEIMGARDHDRHHEVFNVNYGVAFTDELFGTQYVGSDLWKKMQEKSK